MHPLLSRSATLVALSTALVVASVGAPLLASAAEWVCPPCGHTCDELVFDAPGTCPHCGMRLVQRDAPAITPTRVVILLFEGVQIIDFTGPWEVFGQARFAVVTASRDGAPVTTAMGMRVTPHHSLADAPQADLLVIPGGDVEATYRDEAILAWVRRQAEAAEHVLTVCNGAFILARTGLLDGLTATTFYRLLDELERFAPKVQVVRDRRFVDNGRIVTTAGLSSGIDGSLHLVEKILGRGRAQQVALHLEYQWDPESDFARAALADRVLPEVPPPTGSEWRLLASAGDRERWESRYAVVGGVTGESLRRHLEAQLPEVGWHREEAGDTPGGWRFVDRWGRQWRADTEVGSGTEPGEALLTVRLERVVEPPPES